MISWMGKYLHKYIFTTGGCGYRGHSSWGQANGCNKSDFLTFADEWMRWKVGSNDTLIEATPRDKKRPPITDHLHRRILQWTAAAQGWEQEWAGRQDIYYLISGLKYRVFFFLWIQSGGCKSAILRSFQKFLYFLHSKIWAHFHFGTFDP